MVRVVFVIVGIFSEFNKAWQSYLKLSVSDIASVEFFVFHFSVVVVDF